MQVVAEPHRIVDTVVVLVELVEVVPVVVRVMAHQGHRILVVVGVLGHMQDIRLVMADLALLSFAMLPAYR
jgi:hypothetical protein